MTPEPVLTARQAKAVEALLATTSHEEAAKRAGCSSRQIRRYLATPHVLAELRRARTRALDQVASILTAGSAIAARSLVEIADKGGTPRDSVRASAAKAVIDLAGRFEEQGTLAARLAELEEAVAASAQISRKGTWQ